MQKRVTLGIEPSGEARMVLPCEEKLCGEDGHRSHYLAHAKRALYHLSYIPLVMCPEWDSNPRPKTSALNWRLRPLGHRVVRGATAIQTAPGLPIWSPTIVLTGPEGA